MHGEQKPLVPSGGYALMGGTFDGFPLAIRRGLQLVVLIIARISTVHQDRRSLADQIALCENYIRARYSGPVEFVHIQGRGSGEVLDRKELFEAEDGVESGRFDLVVVEDLGRVCRRSRANDFCELCEDTEMEGVRIMFRHSLRKANPYFSTSKFRKLPSFRR